VSAPASAAPRASDAERRSLQQTFAELCAVPSPSREERVCADHVRRLLAEIGVESQEDGAGEVIGGNCGNLLARIPGTGSRYLLLCAHLDTVPLAAPVEPLQRDGFWENANAGILGADNKAAVAVMLELSRRQVARPAECGIELLFTVGEEISLAGARAFDAGRLFSDFGYVFDHASPIGEVVIASPTLYRLRAKLRGQSAHAGIRPEDGRSAILAAARAIATMRLGRLDEITTANIGAIAGGGAINVVAERCTVEGEARSLDPERAHETVTEMVERLTDAANAPDCECDLDVAVERAFAGYRTPSSSRALSVARTALAACGYEPREIASGGASDANVLVSGGFDCVNLANGTERNHEPQERVAVQSLDGMLDVAGALLRSATAA
jgi:tripeptide aminopeptidase